LITETEYFRFSGATVTLTLAELSGLAMRIFPVYPSGLLGQKLVKDIFTLTRMEMMLTKCIVG
jgi:hypothetical protein